MVCYRRFTLAEWLTQIACNARGDRFALSALATFQRIMSRIDTVSITEGLNMVSVILPELWCHRTPLSFLALSNGAHHRKVWVGLTSILGQWPPGFLKGGGADWTAGANGRIATAHGDSRIGGYRSRGGSRGSVWEGRKIGGKVSGVQGAI